MDRRHAIRSLAAAAVAPLAVLAPRRRDPIGFPSRVHVDDVGATRIADVFVDGEKLVNVYEFDTTEGWARYYDGHGREMVPRIRQGLVTFTVRED